MPRAFLNSCAREEARKVNEAGRESARLAGKMKDRIWLHEDDWVRMRSPIVVIVGLLNIDGRVLPEERDIFNSWVEGWLSRSRTADFYDKPMRGAIKVLCEQLEVETNEIRLAAWDCSSRLSKNMLLALIGEVDRLRELST